MKMQQEQTPASAAPDLAPLAVHLLKGVVYRDGDEALWGALLQLQARVRDYMAVLNLELVLDEAEGYAFLRSRPDPDAAEGDEGAAKRPRLIPRRALSFPVSLLLALLRKKLAEFDAGGGDTRLVLGRKEIAELVRVFLPETSNEVQLMNQIDAHINKVVKLGFLRPLKTGSGSLSFEVRRILKAFVDAQWLAEFDQRLEAYRVHLAADEHG